LKKLLYIAYFFPPIGGAGVQRSLKFVRYLPEHGWEPTVITARARYWMEDAALLAELVPRTRIRRARFLGGALVHGRPPRLRGDPGAAAEGGPHSIPTPHVAPSPSAPISPEASAGGQRSTARIRMLRSLSGALLVPDPYLGWALPAWRLAAAELRAGSYDAILTTSSPDSTHLIGHSLRRRFGIPWVADFRDPWTRRLSFAPPTPLHLRLHRAMEAACLRQADRVVVTNEETAEDFRRLHRLDAPGKIVVIMNGYDEEDFTKATTWLETQPAPGDASCPAHLRAGILHAGQLNPERPITPFLRGLRLWIDRNPGQAHRASTVFLGAHYDRDRAAVRQNSLEDFVRFEPPRTHLESVAALLRCRALLLLEQNSERGALILPGKVFEYLRSGRPILALVPSGGAADRFVRSRHAGVTMSGADPAEVAAGIDAVLQRADASESVAPGAERGSSADLAAVERRQLTADLARVLDGLCREIR